MREKEKEDSKRKPVGDMTSADLMTRREECQLSALEKDDEPYRDQETTEKPESLEDSEGERAEMMTIAELKTRVQERRNLCQKARRKNPTEI